MPLTSSDRKKKGCNLLCKEFFATAFFFFSLWVMEGYDSDYVIKTTTAKQRVYNYSKQDFPLEGVK